MTLDPHASPRAIRAALIAELQAALGDAVTLDGSRVFVRSDDVTDILDDVHDELLDLDEHTVEIGDVVARVEIALGRG